MQWKRSPGDRWICRVPPDARFTIEVWPQGDGRWAWQVFAGEAVSPMATGIARNLGGAKSTTELLVKRNM